MQFGWPSSLRSRSEIVVNLRAGTARSGLAHLPEVVFFVEPDDALARNAGFRGPQLFGFVVFTKNGDPEPFRGKLELLRQQFPGESDGFVLEVVAEGKVPQHFEECLVAPRVADVVEVVVLSAGADRLLSMLSPRL